MSKTLLEELAEIDLALTEGEATPEQEKRGQEIVQLTNAAPNLLVVVKELLDEQNLIAGHVSESTLLLARNALAEATGDTQ